MGVESKVYFLWAHYNDIISPKQRRNPLLAICSRTLRVAKIGTMLEAMIVCDAYLDQKGGCEEQYRCLDLRCELNKTTWESLWRAMGKKRIPKPPKEGFVAGKGLNALDFPDMHEAFEKHERGSLYLVREKHR